MSYGNSKTLAVGYDNRLAVSSYEVPGILKKSYQRNDDNSLQFTQDQIDLSKFKKWCGDEDVPGQFSYKMMTRLLPSRRAATM